MKKYKSQDKLLNNLLNFSNKLYLGMEYYLNI